MELRSEYSLFDPNPMENETLSEIIQLLCARAQILIDQVLLLST